MPAGIRPLSKAGYILKRRYEAPSFMSGLILLTNYNRIRMKNQVKNFLAFSAFLWYHFNSGTFVNVFSGRFVKAFRKYTSEEK